jgi:hypothetical protein
MNLLPAIILIVVAAIAGYVLGMVDSRVTKVVKDKVDQVAAEDAKQAAEALKKPDEHVVLRVFLDLALKWHIELDGMRVEPNAMTPEQRTRLVNTVVQIRPWIDTKPVAAPTDAPVSVVPAPRPVAPVQTTPDLPPLKIAAANAPTTPPPQRVDFLRGVRSLLQNEVKKTEIAVPLSIVAMIDEVLQKKLAGTPLAEKGVRLEEGSIGEVIVFIGKTRYSGIDAVPDEEIKVLIKAAVAEWEKK